MASGSTWWESFRRGLWCRRSTVARGISIVAAGPSGRPQSPAGQPERCEPEHPFGDEAAATRRRFALEQLPIRFDLLRRARLMT
jgi:hypothetical protein